MVIKGEIDFLNQIADSLEKAEIRLEQAYLNNNPEEFNKLKKFILQLQNKIFEVLV